MTRPAVVSSVRRMLPQAAEAIQRTRQVARSRIDYLAFVYGASARWTVVLVLSILLLIAPLVPGVLGVILTWAGVAFAVLALIQSIVSGVRAYLRWTRVDLVPRPEPFAWNGAQWTTGGVVVPISAPSSDGTRELAWLDPAVDEALRATPAFESTLGARIDGGRFRLTRRLADIGGRSLRHRSASAGAGTSRRLPPARFNGSLVRLASEPTTDAADPLLFGHVRYYDGESSNEVWPLVVAGDRAPASPVGPYVVDRARRLLPLDQSRAANIVGISLYAVAADDRIVIVRQSARNSVAPGAFASSSSGSADPGDFGVRPGGAVASTSALGGIMTGMLRELAEEANVRPDEVDRASAVVTGYYRWLDRGGKPEFTGLVKATCTSDDILGRRLRDGETAFTAEQLFLPAEFLRDEAAAWRRSRATPARRAERAADRLIARLEQLPRANGVNPSGVGAWLAALAYLASYPEWLDQRTPRVIPRTRQTAASASAATKTTRAIDGARS